jgi:hypothetical protein
MMLWRLLRSLFSALGLGGGPGQAAESDAKWEELESLPTGLRVSHSPDRPKARREGASGARFTWVYATTVSATAGPVIIEEFGCFFWDGGRWVFNNYTGKPFSRKDFAEWYACPGAKVLPGHSYTDPRNWGGSQVLIAVRRKWYFIGTDAQGPARERRGGRGGDEKDRRGGVLIR